MFMQALNTTPNLDVCCPVPAQVVEAIGELATRREKDSSALEDTQLRLILWALVMGSF